ncbi:hypothetical protein [Tateyamaria omphalii]|uniref:Uncharacterized protein n=1 Tax=Tateyamaria omphalii TaxID=299262 RepID=A0A1P8MTA3_9RHOB|nr:hypothetical protein [Tateyamaria omphalii]APX11189.1 hypothetical protein BWR18_05415 [Tateyamaria omphalii]
MPVRFRILPDRGLVVVRYTGHAAIDDTMRATRAYVSHPHYAPGQKQLVDFSAITGYEKDYVRFMQMQAEKAGRFAGSGTQSLVVYIAPTPISQELASLFFKSWNDVHAVVPIVQDSETEALTLLGETKETVDTLLMPTSGRRALQ